MPIGAAATVPGLATTGLASGHWVRPWYERMHSDETLDKLADAGVKLVTTHFYKGFGLLLNGGWKAKGYLIGRRTEETPTLLAGFNYRF